MWEPRRLTTLWAFTACYRDSFTFFFYLYMHTYIRIYIKYTSLKAKIQFPKIYERKMTMAGHVAVLGETRNEYTISVGYPEGKRLF
jgi:hypothetical protein